MFWINDNQNFKNIMVANLDGSNVRPLLGSQEQPYLQQPQGIAVDARASRLYWTDKYSQRIYRVWINGTGFQDVMSSSQGQHFYGVTVFRVSMLQL